MLSLSMRKIFVHKTTYTIVLQKAYNELKRVFLTRSTFSSVFHFSYDN